MIWQPIETAPKSGEVLVWAVRYGVPGPVIAHYMGNAPEDHPPIDPGWYYWRAVKSYGKVENGYFDRLTSTPTHWMPLPSSPVRQQLTEKEKA